MQEAAHLVAAVRAHGQAVAAALLRHVAARQRVGMRSRDLLELPHDLLPEPLDRRADRVEARGRRVLDAPVGLERGLALPRRSSKDASGKSRSERAGSSRSGTGTAARAPSARSTRRKRSRRSSGGSARPCGPRRETRGAPSSSPPSATGGRSARGASRSRVTAEAAHDLERCPATAPAPWTPVPPALRGTKTPGEPKRAGPVEFGMTHGTGIYIPVRRSSASLRSIFLRAAMALRLRLAEGFS